ncbi:acyl-CoA synthetase [Microbacterium sp. BWT-B31]|uniref:acyl-CoA synthetase n=1 Tax=Microbacterium sp. BWT-B31 TaxID=3232072 RepID=UPI0035295593
MTKTPQPLAFEVWHVQLARAIFAGIAAAMITFSPDHSAEVGLAVFSGFAIATGIVHLVSVWLVYPARRRWPAVVLGVFAMLAGMISGLPPLRTTTLFFVIVIVWALASGLVETIAGWRALRAAKRGETELGPAVQARDALIVGIVTFVLGIVLLFVRPEYSLDYTIDQAGETFTLTGIILAVGIFGGYAAIVAVYLAIAGFSPRKAQPAAPRQVAAPDDGEPA